jgi:hypothetical protein
MAKIESIATPHEIIEDSGVLEGELGPTALMLLRCAKADAQALIANLFGAPAETGIASRAMPCQYPGAPDLFFNQIRSCRPVGFQKKDFGNTESILDAMANAKHFLVEAVFEKPQFAPLEVR